MRVISWSASRSTVLREKRREQKLNKSSKEGPSNSITITLQSPSDPHHLIAGMPTVQNINGFYIQNSKIHQTGIALLYKTHFQGVNFAVAKKKLNCSFGSLLLVACARKATEILNYELYRFIPIEYSFKHILLMKQVTIATCHLSELGTLLDEVQYVQEVKDVM